MNNLSNGDDPDIRRLFNDKCLIRALCFKLDRLGTLYAIDLDFMGLIDIAWSGSYEYLLLVVWIYYVTDKSMVEDVNYEQFKSELIDFSKRAFSGRYVLACEPWFKELCGDLEHLTILGSPVPLMDPRMNMVI